MTYEPPRNGFRTFVIIWITQSISVFGSALTFFAINIWLVQVLYPRPEQKPELAFALSALGLAFGLPQIFSAPLAGAWADRHDRKRTMIVVDGLSGLVSLLLIALILAQALNLWVLLGLMVIFAVCNAFHGSAFDTSYAMLVSEQQLPRANGMMQTIWSLSAILSPAIAAGIISLPALARQGVLGGALGAALARLSDGTALAIAIDAVTFLLAAGALLFLHVPSPVRTDLGEGKPPKSFWADVREGGLYIWHRRPLLWLLGTFTFINFTGATVAVFETLLLRFNLQPDWSARSFTFETALALLSSVAGIGGVVGGVVISAWGGLKRRRIYGVLLPMIVTGACQIVFGFSPFLFLTAAMAGVITGMIPFMNAHSQAIWQTQTPRELQGRVFSVRRLIAQFSAPMGTLIAGLTGGLFNPGSVMIVMGLAVVIFCVAQLFNPYLLRVEDKAWLDSLAARAENNAVPPAEQPS